MSLVITSILRAFSQLSDPAIVRVLAKSLVITLAIFVVLGVGAWWALDTAIETWVSNRLPEDYSDTVAGVLAVAIGIVAGWLLFRVVAVAVLQFFADEVVAAVEARHYPGTAQNARKLPFREDMSNSMRGIARTLVFNALALPIALVLVFTALGPAIIFLLVNAVLLGRELTDMGWLRYRPESKKDEPPKNEADHKTPVGPFERVALGGSVAGLMLVPFLNILAPVIGAAAGTHMVHSKMKSRHD